MATLLATIGKEALQIYCHLPLTEEEQKNSKEIIEKLEVYFKPKRNVICKRYMFFFYDQEANETFDAYLAALRRLPCSCEFGQLEEELIRDRMVLGIKYGGVRTCMLRRPSPTLDQAAMMCWSSEEQEVSYARGHRQDGKQSQEDQKNDSEKKRDNQGRQDFWRGGNKKASCGYCGRKGKHRTPEACLTWGERCEKWGKNNHFAKVCKQRTTTLHQLEYSEESSSHESTYIIEEEIANVETKKK